MFKQGKYKTHIGFEAIVAQIVQNGPIWVLRGAIRINGTLYMHVWHTNGKSFGTDMNYDLSKVSA